MKIKKLTALTYAVTICTFLLVFLALTLIICSFLYNNLSQMIKNAHIQEFFISTFDVSKDTAATLAITFVVFGLGLIFSWIASFIKALVIRYKYRVLLRSLIRGISVSCLKKSKRFYECAMRFNIESNAGFRMTSSAITHLDNAEKVDFNHFYDAFFIGLENLFNSKSKTKLFDMVWGCIARMRLVESRYGDQINQFTIAYGNLEEKRNDNLREFKNILDKMFDDAQGKNVPNEISEEYHNYLHAISVIQNDWTNLQVENRTLPFIIDQYYIQPIIALTRNNQQLELPDRLNHYLLLTDHYYASMKVVLESYNAIFMSYYREYKLSSKLLMIGSLRLRKFDFLSKSFAR